MKRVIQNFNSFNSFICLALVLSLSLSVSAKAEVSTDASTHILPGIANLDRAGLTKKTDTVHVLSDDFSNEYMFAEPPLLKEGENNKNKILAEYTSQLEKTGWKKGYSTWDKVIDFEKTLNNGCGFLLSLADAKYASKFFDKVNVLEPVEVVDEAIYVSINFISDYCDEASSVHEQIIENFKSVKDYQFKKINHNTDLPPIQKLPQPYGGIRDSSQIAVYSDDLKLADLIDFESHSMLSPLEECHTEELYSMGRESKTFCFVEDISTYGGYRKIETNKIYEKHAPYIITRAAMYFRKQGFVVATREDSDESEAIIKADNEYYELSRKQNLPRNIDSTFVTQIKPSGCLITAWLFIAEEGSRLWDGVEYKTIKIKKENDNDNDTIEEEKIYAKRMYLVSLAASEACVSVETK